MGQGHKQLNLSNVVYVPYPALGGNNQVSEALSTLKLSGPANPNVLVLESVIITGDRISSIAEQWRKSKLKCRMNFIVGLIRSESYEMFKHLKKRIEHEQVHGSTCDLTVAENIVLPKWGRNQCPWCKEAALLDRITGDAALKPKSKKHLNHFTKRLEFLRAGEVTGIVRDVLHGRVTQNDNREFNRTDGSLFFNTANLGEGVVAKSADWQLAVASTLQNWRTDNITNSNVHIDFKPIVGAMDFNDPLLRASIFRSLLPEEVLKIQGEDRKQVIGYITDKTKFKNDSHNHFCLGSEAVLSFGKLLRNIETSEVLDTISSTILNAVIARS